jgi:adenosine kinase
MTAPRYDVLGIGNAIVDVIARAEDDFLVAQGMHKGTMALIDEARAQTIYAAMGPAVESSGGSAANTIVGVASFGAKAAFVGKVKNDDLGRTFTHDIRAANVAFDTNPASGGPSTARCYIMVTPDGERTMNTYLGAAQDLKPGDIDEAQVANAAVTYLEGYLWDPPQAKEAFIKAAERAEAKLAVVTRSEKGCVVVSREAVEAVAAEPVEQVADVTGAGDLFAAGFLVGLSRGKDHRTSARLGALAAAEVIQHIGARPAMSLKARAAESGLAV